MHGSRRFSLLQFYERRARRLLPALFVMIAASYIVATYMLVPSAMKEFAASAAASGGFFSNIFWWFESNEYGARSGLVQPLLHTWSLAVEEQFYLFFPLIYVAVLARENWSCVWIGAAALLLGFIFASLVTERNFLFSFYMICSRIWELVAGALLAHVLATRPDLPRKIPFASALPAAGLLMISASLIAVPLTVNHPGLGTLGAVLGTVLVIAFARRGEPVTNRVVISSTEIFRRRSWQAVNRSNVCQCIPFGFLLCPLRMPGSHPNL